MSAEETHEAYICGKTAVKEKTHDLMVNVLNKYKTMQENLEETSSEYQVVEAQISAIKYTLDFVDSGGHTSFVETQSCLS